MTDSYRDLLARLAELHARVDAQRAEAHAWYADQCAKADRAVREATDAVRRAEAEVAAAREEVESTEAEAAHLWQTLRGRLGPAARRAGTPPVPVAGAEADPGALLDGVRDLLDRVRQPGELSGAAQPVLAFFGACGAAASFGLGLVARATGERYGGDLSVGMPVLALVVTLLGPVVGLAPAKLYADRRHAGLDIRAVLVVLVAGLLTTAALLVLTR
nr:hypothetical protein [Micromonospora sp. DSM 115978]